MGLTAARLMAIGAIVLAAAAAAAQSPGAAAKPAVAGAQPKSSAQPQPSAPVKKETAEEREDREERELEQSLAESGSSPVDYARALERHLRKYPNTSRRADLERVLAQAAIDARDTKRILLYGIPAIEAGLRSPQALDFVTRALLDLDSKDSLERALRYAGVMKENLEKGLARLRSPEEHFNGRGRRFDETEKALARALAFEARALGKLGRVEEAVESARKAYATAAAAETARELARWLEAAGKPGEALEAASVALAYSSDSPSDAARQKDLARLGTLAQAAGVSPADALLKGFQTASEQAAARNAKIVALDANAFASSPMEYVLTSPEGGRLELASLKGKVVVFDFWATWCGPCRVQHPLYEQVKERFKGNPDVVFLAVSTDEDRAVVKPFLERNRWSKDVWFEDGLGLEFRISSIPTTIVLDRNGGIHSRMNGFIENRFADMLSARIREALQEN